jgi:hypothetical protein
MLAMAFDLLTLELPETRYKFESYISYVFCPWSGFQEFGGGGGGDKNTDTKVKQNAPINFTKKIKEG